MNGDELGALFAAKLVQAPLADQMVNAVSHHSQLSDGLLAPVPDWQPAEDEDTCPPLIDTTDAGPAVDIGQGQRGEPARVGGAQAFREALERALGMR